MVAGGYQSCRGPTTATFLAIRTVRLEHLVIRVADAAERVEAVTMEDVGPGMWLRARRSRRARWRQRAAHNRPDANRGYRAALV